MLMRPRRAPAAAVASVGASTDGVGSEAEGKVGGENTVAGSGDGEGGGIAAVEDDPSLWPTVVVVVEARQRPPPPAPTDEAEGEEADSAGGAGDISPEGDAEEEGDEARELATKLAEWEAEWAPADEENGVGEGARAAVLARLEKGGARVVRLSRAHDDPMDSDGVAIEALVGRVCAELGLRRAPAAASSGDSSAEDCPPSSPEDAGGAASAPGGDDGTPADGGPSDVDDERVPLSAVAAERSKTLRRWLLRSVVPAVAQALTELAKDPCGAPADPVDALADALLAGRGDSAMAAAEEGVQAA